MIRSSMLSLVLLGSILASGCVKRIPETEPADIPRLLAAVQASPYDPDLLTQLGMAQYRARRLSEAESTLSTAVATGEAPGLAYLYLGLAREDREEWSGAREAYLSYLDRGRSDPLKQEIEDRLALVIREEFRARAREAVAQEEELSQESPTPGSVAVLPFRLLTEDPELEPLQVALSDMMTTDLSLSGGVTVLERAQVQSLVREMDLTEAGYVDPQSGARAGRMLRAEHVIQGALAALPEDTLRFDTDVLNTGQARSAGDATALEPLDDLFDMEKEVVFRVLDILGVEITAAEREAIGQNRAANLLAFLAYGRGLRALDEGNYDQAQAFFGEALRADPGFGPAQEGSAEAQSLVVATEVTPFEISSLAAPEISPPTLETSTVDPGVLAAGTSGGMSTILDATTEGLMPSPAGVIIDLGTPTSGAEDQSWDRNPVQEAGDQEGITQPSVVTIRITIRIPAGGE